MIRLAILSLIVLFAQGPIYAQRLVEEAEFGFSLQLPNRFDGRETSQDQFGTTCVKYFVREPDEKSRHLLIEVNVGRFDSPEEAESSYQYFMKEYATLEWIADVETIKLGKVKAVQYLAKPTTASMPGHLGLKVFHPERSYNLNFLFWGDHPDLFREEYLVSRKSFKLLER